MSIRCPLLVQVRSHVGGGGTRPAGERQDLPVSQSHHFRNRLGRKDQMFSHLNIATFMIRRV